MSRFMVLRRISPVLAKQPIGTILSAAMLLRYSLKEELAARCVEAAVYAAVQKGYRTADIYTDNTTLVNTKEMEKVIIHEMQTFR